LRLSGSEDRPPAGWEREYHLPRADEGGAGEDLRFSVQRLNREAARARLIRDRQRPATGLQRGDVLAVAHEAEPAAPGEDRLESADGRGRRRPDQPRLG